MENKTLDDQVLLKRDGLPTYNFANVVDDHLMGITHVVRGSEYLASAPKYNLLYEAFGWEVPTYVHCSPVMRDHHNKMSKRHGDPSYEDLKAEGYLTAAILNYVALLGWSPKGELAEQELFSLSELVDAFGIAGISKSPAIFDIGEAGPISTPPICGPWSRRTLPGRQSPISARAVKDPRASTPPPSPPCSRPGVSGSLDIPEKVDFFDALPDYPVDCSPTRSPRPTREVARAMLEAAIPALEGLTDLDRRRASTTPSSLWRRSWR